MGIATDGDGGGCGIILENGDWLDIQSMSLVLLWHLIEQKEIRGNILKSSIIPDSVSRAIQSKLMTVIETTPEDDPNEMSKPGWILGMSDKGEFSFGPELPERDGILTGLLFTEMVAISGRPLRMLVDTIQRAAGRAGQLSIDKNS